MKSEIIWHDAKKELPICPCLEGGIKVDKVDCLVIKNNDIWFMMFQETIIRKNWVKRWLYQWGNIYSNANDENCDITYWAYMPLISEIKR